MVAKQFEKDRIEVLVSVIESEFAFLEMQIEGVVVNAVELGESSFGRAPEGLDAVDVV